MPGTTPTRGNSLYVGVDATTWTEAYSLAVQIGGHLVAINSAEEDNFVWNNFKNQELSSDGYNWGYWMGLRRDLNSDPRLTENWYWVNGERLNYLNTSFDPENLSSEPNGGYNDLYAHVWGYNKGTHEKPLWNDVTNQGNPGTYSYAKIGVAEVPLNLSIDASDIPKEGSGVFTTSINLSAGSETTGNLAEGAEVYWQVSGITADDLSSGKLSGSGVITNGKLSIEHSLVNDDDSGESLKVSVFSDVVKSQQIGTTAEFLIEEKSGNTSPTDLSISASTFDENIAGGSSVATLNTTDPDSQDSQDSHTYSLVSGDGNTDNSAFTIDGDQLKINASPDYETQDSYSIRLRTTDSGGLTFEKAFDFTVNDLQEEDAIQNSYLTREWSQLLGASSPFSDDGGRSISIAGDGSIYITGYTRGDLDGQTNSGNYDAFISKFNSDGSKQWTQLLGTSGKDDSWSISTADDGSVYITGFTQGDLDGQTNNGYGPYSDAFISKFNSDGSKQWTQLLGTSTGDAAWSISTADDGSIYITGDTSGDLDGQTNSGNYDAFISKFNSDGSKQWTQLLGASSPLSDDGGRSISIAGDGSIYITGYTGGDLDGQTNSGNYDAFISKFKSDGSKQWTQLLGTSGKDDSWSISTANDGSVYITGDTKGDLDGQTNSGNYDAFISKFNSDGSKQWTQLLGTSKGDAAWSISTADDGSIYITGDTSGDLDGQPNSGGYDAFISKFTIKNPPIDLSTSASSFNENIAAESLVATLSSIDPDSSDTFTYSLVNGTGDTDNTAFTVDGDQLKVNASPDYETQESYSVRLQTEDSGGLTFEKSFTFDVIDLNDVPEPKVDDESVGKGFSIGEHLFIPVSRGGKTFLIKSDVQGRTIWEKEVGGGTAIRAKTDGKGNIYLISGTHETGCTISKLDANGNLGWEVTPKTNGGDWYEDLEFLGGKIIVSGGTNEGNGSFNAGRRAKLLTLSETGQQLDVNTYEIGGSLKAARFTSVTTDGNDLYLTATPYRGVDYDNAITCKIDGQKLDNVIWENRISNLGWNWAHSARIFGDYLVSIGSTAIGGDKQNNRIVFSDLQDGQVKYDKNWGDGNAQILYGIDIKDDRLFVAGIDGNPWGASDTKPGFGAVYEIDKNANIVDSIKLDITNHDDMPRDVISTDSGYVVTGLTRGLPGHTLKLFTNYRQLNYAPTDITFSTTKFNENIAAESAVATLSSTDPDDGDTFTYSLVNGTGDADNTAFTIDGNQLKIVDSPDFETKSSYSIRVQTNDSGGLIFDKEFTLNVNDIKPETIRSSKNLTLPDNVENLVITGSENLKGYGNSSNNRLTGNSGDNLLDGKGGIDTLIGKGGNDTYIVNHVSDKVIEKADGGTDTIRSSVNETLSAHIENLVLTGTRNLKGFGNSSNNRLIGNSGNNLLDGKGGIDTLIGKEGNDTYIVNHVSDKVIEKANGGTDTIRSSVNETLGAHVENLVLTGKANLQGYGNSGKNRLTGNSGNNVLDGKGGIDVMSGKEGNDTYIVNHVSDKVIEKANGGTDTIKSSVNETLSANVENLVLTGSENLKGYGNSDSNRMVGNSGNNVLDGKGGIDVMSGKGGNDTYIVDNSKDRVIEKADAGTDTIKSSVNETLSTHVENLVLTGTGNLKGYGNSSNNRLTGNSGNNVLEGKAGRDVLTGKGGGDMYVYRSTDDSGITKSTRDVITDFDGTRSDVIDLSTIDAYTAKSGNQTFVYIGSDPFSGTQGEVRFASSILGVNTGTDKQADMQIQLNGVTYFNSDFLIL